MDRLSDTQRTMPPRIQRRRTKGWRKPAGAVYVGRVKKDHPSKWGNRYEVGRDGTAEECVQLFEARYQDDTTYQAAVRAALRGKPLMCWCKPGAPCHADVLLR